MSLNLPSQLVAGDRWRIVSTDLYYFGDRASPETHDLTISIASEPTIQLTSTPMDGKWISIAGSAETGAISPGTYQWGAALDYEGDRQTIGCGNITIAPNLIAANMAIDGRTDDEILYERVQNAITCLLKNKPIEEYEIMGRKAKYYNITELYEIRNRLRGQISAARRRQSGKGRRRYARFDPYG